MPGTAGRPAEPPALSRGDGRTWRERAACRGAGPALFYSLDPAAIAAAKQVCRACPVRSPCAHYAAANGETEGVWGGLAPEERSRPSVNRRPGSGPTTWVSDDELRDLFAAADPDLPALEQLLEHTPVASATAYKYLARARRLGVVEQRGWRLFPTAR